MGSGGEGGRNCFPGKQGHRSPAVHDVQHAAAPAPRQEKQRFVSCGGGGTQRRVYFRQTREGCVPPRPTCAAPHRDTLKHLTVNGPQKPPPPRRPRPRLQNDSTSSGNAGPQDVPTKKIFTKPLCVKVPVPSPLSSTKSSRRRTGRAVKSGLFKGLGSRHRSGRDRACGSCFPTTRLVRLCDGFFFGWFVRSSSSPCA